DRSLSDNRALRSDILAESRQKGAGHMSTEPVRMSRHVMWHERRAVQQKNRGRLSGKRGIFPVKRQRRGASSCCGRAHRLQRREPLPCLLMLMDSTFNVLQTSIN